MELRSKKSVNYRLLHAGDTAPIRSHHKQSRSLSRLWSLEVTGTRISEGREEVFVHYKGWPNTFDEWRQKTDIVIKPAEHENSDAYALFVTSLRIQIKEHLNVFRVRDTQVTVEIPVQRETFSLFLKEAGASLWKERRSQQIYRGDISSLQRVLGKNFFYHVCNAAGDFASIDETSVTLWLKERPCLTEFNSKLEKRPLHRGYTANFRFVKRLYNRTDMSAIREYLQ